MSFPLDPELWTAGASPSAHAAGNDDFEDDSMEFEESGEDSAGSLYETDSDVAEPQASTSRSVAEAEGGQNKDLDRLIQSAFYGDNRETLLNPSAPAGALGESWDRSIRDVLEDMENDPTTRSGRTRRRGRRSAAVTLSPEIKNLLAQANAKYMQEDYKAAVEVLQEIIRIEPNTKAAFHTLSAIHTDLGNKEKALQLEIIAAHIAPKEAGAWKDLGAASRQAGLLQQAIYCYSQAVAISRNDVDAIWDRSVLYAEVGRIGPAISGFSNLLKLNPHDLTTLRELVPVLIMAEDVPGATKRLQDAFDYHVKMSPNGPTEWTVQIQDIVDLIDLLKSQRRFREVVPLVKLGQRWLQGRYESGSAWSLFEDDREYDTERRTRPQWQKNEQLRWLEDEPTYELDFRLRTALGIARLMMGDMSEADVHLATIKELDVLDHFGLIGEVADAYLEKKYFQTALELYQELADCEVTNSPPVWSKIAECNKALGHHEVAIECYEAVLEAIPDDEDSRLKLAEIYEDLGDRMKALQLVNEVLQARRENQRAPEAAAPESQLYDDEDAIVDIDPSSLFAEKGPLKQITKTKRKEVRRAQRHETEMQRQADFEVAYQRLAFLDHGLLAGDAESTKEWLDVASYLIDGFRETPALFPRDGKTKYQGITSRSQKRRKAAGGEDVAAELADRLERAMSDSDQEGRSRSRKSVTYSDTFCNITFDDWLVLALRYAFVLTTNGEGEEADTVLRHLCMAANFRQSPEKLMCIMLAIVACLIHVGNLDAASSDFRRVVLRYNHLQTQHIRVLSSMFFRGQAASLAYSDAKLQKFNLRTIKQIDNGALGLDKSASRKGKKGSRAVDEDIASDEEEVESGATFKPTKINPHLLSFYAHSLAMSKSHQSAIYYYLRAYEACPTDPLICFTTGLAYLHRAMQRQTDNRHHQIAQGFTLLAQYRQIRGPGQEVEYNFGRAFHMLGLYGLALKHYQRVLSMAEVNVGSSPQVSGTPVVRYAAFNLQQIYLADGAPLAAKAVGERWLAF